MEIIEVRTEVEFQAALKKPGCLIDLLEGVYQLVTQGTEAPFLRVSAKAALSVVARESSQPSVEARESSQPSVEARESSQPSVVARESSQPRVEAWGSSQPSVVARESSQPSVEAWGSSQPSVVARESSQPSVVAWESSQPSVVARESSQPRVEAWGYVQLQILGAVVAKLSAKVACLVRGKGAKVTGGVVTRVRLKTPRDWCDFYGVRVQRSHAVLYKALNKGFVSPHGMKYAVGTTVVAPDWDGGKVECGYGLHFSPTPAMTREFVPDPKHYVACAVPLKEMAFHPEGSYPSKCKAKSCKVLFECDRDGEEVKK